MWTVKRRLQGGRHRVKRCASTLPAPLIPEEVADKTGLTGIETASSYSVGRLAVWPSLSFLQSTINSVRLRHRHHHHHHRIIIIIITTTTTTTGVNIAHSFDTDGRSRLDTAPSLLQMLLPVAIHAPRHRHSRETRRPPRNRFFLKILSLSCPDGTDTRDTDP